MQENGMKYQSLQYIVIELKKGGSSLFMEIPQDLLQPLFYFLISEKVQCYFDYDSSIPSMYPPVESRNLQIFILEVVPSEVTQLLSIITGFLKRTFSSITIEEAEDSSFIT